MRKLNKILKTIIVCLFAIICLGTNITMVANATEGEGSVVAIVEIQNYSVEGGMIEAGKEITVNFTLHNASNYLNASSVIMTLNNSTGIIYPSYGKSNQVYVGNILAGGTKEVSVPLVIGDTFSGTAVDLTCQFEYISQNSRMTNTSTIVIPTSGGSTIGVKSIDVSSHAIVNGKSLLAFSYVNQSSANITDAKLVLDGNVSSASKEIKLDTVYAGKSYTNDYYVIFDEAGNQTINVSLQYTDADGEIVVNDLGSFDITVSKESVNSEDESNIAHIVELVGKVGALVFAVLTLIVIAIYVKKR
ncbi:hypothetical protein SAMN04487831_1148 [Pseudobutyrivibrio sp. UC1225]|uniref:hypothetical protein n=1 Tax=Pseudobutyrivibrio sp. UC1225 TaxID=1798185 RepID=UPI0008E9065C|nr:hypothetical protein [Pseudobutyrivibrio sp. UC1225]SFO24610.1 hypothetical protein SAMN04487831_1148 [Pseudobutyrivibrio sp. UC1225]